MKEQRAKGMLGLAVRSREACFGDDTCSRLIESGKCGLILLDGETGANTRKKYQELCERTGAEPIQQIGRRFVMYRPSRENPRIVIEG